MPAMADGDWPEEARAAAVKAIDARISASTRVSAPCSADLATDILNAVAPLIRAAERERIAAFAECWNVPAYIDNDGDEAAVEVPFADLIRKQS